MWLRTVSAIVCITGVGSTRLNASFASTADPGLCQAVVFEGELNAGQPLARDAGHGLQVYFQPIASGWILRILPSGTVPEVSLGRLGGVDYAEIATPPYRSVTPLSLSTDFAFRSQDAVAWNPRRFRFAANAGDFARLQHAAAPFFRSTGKADADAEAALTLQLRLSAEGMLTILDARLVPGSADQWRAAAAVASHFATTAHTIVDGGSGVPSPLGRLVWLRVRVDLLVPLSRGAGAGRTAVPRKCGTL